MLSSLGYPYIQHSSSFQWLGNVQSKKVDNINFKL